MIKNYFFLLLAILIQTGIAGAQSLQSKSEIKNHFQNGYAPGAVHFGYLIDACYNYSVGEGLVHDPANNVLKAEVPLRILEQHLADTARTLRNEQKTNFSFVNQELLGVKSSLQSLDVQLLNRIKDTEQAIRSDYQNSLLALDANLTQEIDATNEKMIQQELQILTRLKDSIRIVKQDISLLNSNSRDWIKNLETDLENQIAELSYQSSLELRDTAQNIRLALNAGLEKSELALTDSCRNIRTSLENKTQALKNNIDQNHIDITSRLQNLSAEKTSEIADTARAVRTDLNSFIHRTNTSLSGEIIRIDGALNGIDNRITTTAFDIRTELDVNTNRVESALQDTARNIREYIDRSDAAAESKSFTELSRLDAKITTTQSALQDTAFYIRSDFNNKLERLEESLQDTAKVIRKSLKDFNEGLQLQIESGDLNLESLLKQAEQTLIKKIDSLAEVHSLDRRKQEDRMALSEQNHSVLKDTVVKMKVKLDTLNYTEENFTQSLKLKLDNVEDGATRSDNNFTDELKTKLDGIEQNANNYQLPLATHNKKGGVQLSSEFVLYSGKLYTTLNPDNIDRQYAKDTLSGIWNPQMEKGDVWTRVRYKTENGSVDEEGNKLYDYGEWNQAYKFVYDDLESSFYEFNATDSANVILGIHEKNKKFTGEDNTLLGHHAGYNLYRGGQRNVAIGKNAGRASENVSDNVFVGNQAGESIGDPLKTAELTGDYSSERNVAVGTRAMQGRNASGTSTAIGYGAMELGEQNSTVAIGYKAAAANSGTNNVLIGYEAGLSVPGSKNNNNIAIGFRSGYKTTYAKRNILLGDSTAFASESGENNIFIGHGSGKTNQGNGNLFIGNDINSNGNDQLRIGNQKKILISGDFTSGTVAIDQLNTQNLKVTNSSSDAYSVGNNEVINASSQFVGQGGVNTPQRIISTYATTKTSTSKSIAAPNGSVGAKYISANQSFQIGSNEVVNSTAEFVGSGGVNTSGNIRTSAAVTAKDLNSGSAKFSQSLAVAGLDLVKYEGAVITERYAVQKHQHLPSDVTTDTENRFVKDADISNWNNKVDKLAGKGLSANDFTSAYKTKLDGIATGANHYVHPASHPANMITQDATHQFISNAERNTWNNKVDKAAGKGLSANDFTSAYKTKLDGIATGANRYVHPASHPANMITQDATHQFISNAERNTWNNKVDKASGKALSSNDFTSAYKTKLDGIATGANRYVHPSSHSASMIVQDAAHRFVKDADISNWNNKVDKLAGKGLSANDFTNAYKTKLEGIATNANHYVHPSSHSASMISQDAAHRFVSDAEKNTWNNKADKADLSSNDYTDAEKNKLAGIQAGANKYIHPATHSADEVTTSTDKQFVSQTEKDQWNAGQIPLGGIIMWNGTNVPKGWALCNGQSINGKTTPDLRGRFIVGSDPAKTHLSTGKTGGTVNANSVAATTSSEGVHKHTGTTGGYKLEEKDIPAHRHEFKNYFFSENSAYDDSRTASSYGFEYIQQGMGSRASDNDNNRVYYKRMDTEVYGTYSYSQNSHQHSISEDGNHNHTVTMPYYVLAFIMRVE